MACNIAVLALVLVVTALAGNQAELTSQELSDLQTPGQLTISTDGNYLVVASNGLANHYTDDFPTWYNPNTISSQNHNFYIPKYPANTSQTTCLPLGSIGVATSGIPFYNPLTNELKNAVQGDSRELFDKCSGHPDMRGTYHYHQNANCTDESKMNNHIVGVALDGYPIYSMYDASGVVLTSADLDDCHGRTVDGNYRYHVTADCPYVLGCFWGSLHSNYQASTQRSNCVTTIRDSSYCSITDSGSSGGGSGTSPIGETNHVPMLTSLAIATWSILN